MRIKFCQVCGWFKRVMLWVTQTLRDENDVQELKWKKWEVVESCMKYWNRWCLVVWENMMFVCSVWWRNIFLCSVWWRNMDKQIFGERIQEIGVIMNSIRSSYGIIVRPDFLICSNLNTGVILAHIEWRFKVGVGSVTYSQYYYCFRGSSAYISKYSVI